MYGILIGVHIVVCVCLVLIVLFQAGRGAGLAGVFGASSGGGSQFFGARGAAPVLGKATGVLAVVFMITSITLSLLSGGGGEGGAQRSLLQREAARQTRQAPTGTMESELRPFMEEPVAAEEAESEETQAPSEEQSSSEAQQ